MMVSIPCGGMEVRQVNVTLCYLDEVILSQNCLTWSSTPEAEGGGEEEGSSCKGSSVL